MAELAGAAILAEEAVTYTAAAGVGAYKLAQPTMPLKATFTQIATSSSDETRLSLTRSGHSLSIIDNKAFIFGGETATGKLASTDIHAVTIEYTGKEKPESEYSIIPAIPDVEGGEVPAARKDHAACAFNVCVAVFGGVDDNNDLVDEDSRVWLYNSGKSAWEMLQLSGSGPKPQPRRSASLSNHKNSLVLYGGRGRNGEELKDVWHFDYAGKAWCQLAEAPVFTASAAYADGALYLLSASDNVSSDLHYLRLDAKNDHPQSWHTVSFPTNPLTPGPQPRTGAGLLHISPGHGRNFLLYIFGAKQKQAGQGGEEQPEYWSDIWVYQLPSSSPEVKPTTSISEAIKPANIKDTIRNAFGFDTGKHSWTELEVLPPADMGGSEGKVHPGPRGFFACDVTEDRKGVVVWGGINAKGEKEGDGWLIKI